MLKRDVTDTLEPWSLIPTSPSAFESTQCIAGEKKKSEIDNPDILTQTMTACNKITKFVSIFIHLLTKLRIFAFKMQYMPRGLELFSKMKMRSL